MENDRKLRRQAFGLIIGLSVQFLLGTAVNLFVKFPESGGAKVMWEYARTQPLVLAHIIVGTLLLLGAVPMAIMSARQKEKVWRWASFVGLLFILMAWLSGEEFISSQQDPYSLSMAGAFILAIISYCWGILRTSA